MDVAALDPILLLQEAEETSANAETLLASLAQRRQHREEAQERLENRRSRLFYKAVGRLSKANAGSLCEAPLRKLVSVYDGKTEYVIGKPTGQGLETERYFVYTTLEEALSCPFPQESQLMDGKAKAVRAKVPLVVLLVAGLGQPEYHGHGKFSFPQLMPVAVIPRSWKNPHRWRT
mmetsp:Transcript_62503/g.111067  ORF Transcript_62503/g.111067 Transcript_62503/m.111067 type:complete len:176 (+) Transcript_62503:46-573(+)